jgi:signal transduction histidine kinase
VNDTLSCGLSGKPAAGSAARGGPGLAATAVVMAAIGSLTALTIWGQFDTHTAARLLALDIVVGVAACALLPVLLRWPVPGALALAALAVVSPAATPAATFGTLYVAQRRRFAVAAAVGAAGVVTHAVRGLLRPIAGLPFSWWLVLVIVAEAALVGWGQLTQARRALIASLQDRARRAEAEQGRRVAEARAFERTRIAREMHDVLAHRLSLLATYAGAIEYRPDAPPEQLAQAAGVVRAGAHQALDELREVITVLRDDVSPGDGDRGQRPQPGLADLPRLVGESRDAGESVQMEDRVSEPGALPGAAGRTAYRVVQEGLTNARKHAPGQPVHVVLEGRPGERLVIDISNPLHGGHAAPAAMAGSGTGLIGLTERVRLAGGELDQQITPAGEFRLCARLPWPA